MSRLIKTVLSLALGIVVAVGLFGCAGVEVPPSPTPPTPEEDKFEISLTGEAKFGGENVGSGYSKTITSKEASLSDWNIDEITLTGEKSKITYKFVLENKGTKNITVGMVRPTNVPSGLKLSGGVITGGTESSPTFGETVSGKDSISIAKGKSQVIFYTLEVSEFNKDIPAVKLDFKLTIE